MGNELENIVINWKNTCKSPETDFKFGENDIITGNLPYLLPSAIPAALADYVGVFGAYGTLDSTLTVTSTLGLMAGFFGRYKDACTLTGLTYFSIKVAELAIDCLKDGKINNVKPDLENNLFALLGSVAVGYVLKNVIKKFI